MIVEIVCCSPDDCVEAQSAGADRIELCSAIALGGLTPSLGLVSAALSAVDIPIFAMVRPRGGGFLYSDREFDSMLEDANTLRAKGIVTGVLNADRTVDTKRSRKLAEIPGQPAVFHRAFDATPDPFRALEEIIDCGYVRILTSGQKARATDSIDLIKRLIDAAKDRIEILPAGGLRPANVADFAMQTGCTQVHLAPFKLVEDPTHAADRGIAYGIAAVPSETHFRLTDAQQVRAVVEALAT